MSEDSAAKLSSLQAQLGRVILGKPEAIEHVLVALLAGHHLLMEDVPGVGQDDARQGARPLLLGRVPAGAVHARPPARRHPRLVGLQPARRQLHVQGRPRLRERAPRRRDQPRLAPHAVRPPRGDERGAGLERGGDAGPAHALPRPRHAEPGGVPRHLPAARGPARPLRPAHRHRLPRGGAGGRRALQPGGASPARVRDARALGRGRGEPAGGSAPRPRGAHARALHGRPGRGHAAARVGAPRLLAARHPDALPRRPGPRPLRGARRSSCPRT